MNIIGVLIYHLKKKGSQNCLEKVTIVKSGGRYREFINSRKDVESKSG